MHDDERFMKEETDKYKTPDEHEGRSCFISFEGDTPHAHDAKRKECDKTQPREQQEDEEEEEDIMLPSSQFL